MAANSTVLTAAQALTQRILKSRPSNIPDHIFEGLASMGCTESEIAALTKSTKTEVENKKDAIASGRARLKHALRRAQIKAALKGNSSMLIWLGKTYLNQRENPDPTITQQTNIVVDSKLLTALQSSYKLTLEDIRRVKASSLPDNQPASHTSDPLSLTRGTLGSLVTPEDTEAYPESHNLTYLPDTQCTSYGTEPITSHNSDSVYALDANALQCGPTVTETHPPAAGPAPQTHTPSPSNTYWSRPQGIALSCMLSRRTGRLCRRRRQPVPRGQQRSLRLAQAANLASSAFLGGLATNRESLRSCPTSCAG